MKTNKKNQATKKRSVKVATEITHTEQATVNSNPQADEAAATAEQDEQAAVSAPLVSDNPQADEAAATAEQDEQAAVTAPLVSDDPQADELAPTAEQDEQAAVSAPLVSGDPQADEPAATATPDEQTAGVMLNMERIRTSPFNARRTYDQNTIGELADTLKEVGLIQPIRVRIVNGNFEIVCGERRYRAAKLAGWKKIEGLICDVSDEVARDMILIENLQREDLPPMEEAAAYKALIEEGNDIHTLAAKYGKSDSYIYGRLRLNDLIPEIADLLNRQLIGIGLSLELAKCERGIQIDIYENHLKAEAEKDTKTYGWRGKSVTDFKSLMMQTYTTDLQKYRFDKTECRDCWSNTNKRELFPEAGSCGRCTNRECLTAKNNAFVLEQTRSLLKSDPRLTVARSQWDEDNPVAKAVEQDGHPVKKVSYSYSFPEEPSAPVRQEYMSDEDFAKEQECFDRDHDRYEKRVEEIRQEQEQGRAEIYVRPGSTGAELVWVPVNKRPKETDFVKRLTEQKAANDRLKLEKITKDVCDFVKGNREPDTPLTLFEGKLLYFILMGGVKPMNRKMLDESLHENGRIPFEKRQKIVENLTPEQRTMVTRDYITHFLTQYTTDEISAAMLREYANLHYPEQYMRIYAEYDEIYTNRNTRLDERIAEYEAKEKVRAEAEAKKAAKVEKQDAEPAAAEKAESKKKSKREKAKYKAIFQAA